jgi:uncharacterized protein YlxW (UPF0749 family)
LDLPRLKAALLDSLYHAQLNLLLRKQAEIERERDVLQFVAISAAEQQRRDDLTQRVELLENSIRGLDSTILLMESF